MAEEAEIIAAREYLDQVRRAEPVAWRTAEPPATPATPAPRRAVDAAPAPEAFSAADDAYAPEDFSAAGDAYAPESSAAAGDAYPLEPSADDAYAPVPSAAAGDAYAPEPSAGEAYAPSAAADDAYALDAFTALDAPTGPIFLVLTDAGAELRDEHGTVLYGRLVDLPDSAAGPVVGAEMADCVCRIGAERDRRGRLVAARLADGSVVAACHLSWRAGGHVWLATDDWYRLRSRPLASGPAWMLTAGDDEVAEIRPLPNHGLEIDMAATPPDAVLLLLLVAMVIHAETVPLAQPVSTGLPNQL